MNRSCQNILTAQGSNQDMFLDDLAGKKIVCQLGTQSHETVNVAVLIGLCGPLIYEVVIYVNGF